MNTKDLNKIILESTKKVLRESSVVWYVVDDGGTYNVLSSDMFDEKGRYIENKNYTIEDFDIVKTTPNEQMAWNYADKMNREYQEQYGDFQPSQGYFNESKKMKITESKLRQFIQESIQEIFEEAVNDEDYDNVTPEELKSYNDNYYGVIVPEWALPALVNGDYTGLDDEEIADVKAFERNFVKGGYCELANGLTAGDCCVPLEGKSPSYCPYNDINRKGANCYRFAFPAK